MSGRDVAFGGRREREGAAVLVMQDSLGSLPSQFPLSKIPEYIPRFPEKSTNLDAFWGDVTLSGRDVAFGGRREREGSVVLVREVDLPLAIWRVCRDSFHHLVSPGLVNFSRTRGLTFKGLAAHEQGDV